MNNRFVMMLPASFFVIMLLTTSRVLGENTKKDGSGGLNTRQLLSMQPTERKRALEDLTANYCKVSSALLKTLEDAKAEFIMDHRCHSPLHCAILAVETWQVVDADELLLSMVDYELDIESLPDGMFVLGDYFFPAAKALVHLRVDIAKVERALAAAENAKVLRILTWVLLEREKDIEKVKMALTDIRDKSHGATEKQNINKSLELLNVPSALLPVPSRVENASSM